MIIPHQFVAGTKAKAQEVNDNFVAVSEELSTLAQNITNNNATIMSNLNSQISTLEEQFEAFKAIAYPIGSPKAVLDDTLNENEIWLEGDEVSKTTYAALYEIYGNTYGTPEDTDNFVLPDFRGRVMWGASDFGYIEAGLPNITGTLNLMDANISGAFYKSGGSQAYGFADYDNVNVTFDASRSSSVYGNSETVQPPAVKVRVKTRYK